MTHPADTEFTLTQEQTKTCYMCKETKPASDFYRNKASRDGLQSYCKPCMRSYVKRRNAASRAELPRKKQTKTCYMCKQTKPVTSFNRSRSNLDGRHSYCRMCAHKYHQQRQARATGGSGLQRQGSVQQMAPSKNQHTEITARTLETQIQAAIQTRLRSLFAGDVVDAVIPVITASINQVLTDLTEEGV